MRRRRKERVVEKERRRRRDGEGKEIELYRGLERRKIDIEEGWREIELVRVREEED